MNFGWLAFIAFVSVLMGRSIYRRWRSYQRFLEPELQKRGYTLVSSKPAPLFSSIPFRRFELEIGQPQYKTPFGNGRFTAVRVVVVEDNKGNKKTAWAKLEFVLLRLRQIKWQGI